MANRALPAPSFKINDLTDNFYKHKHRLGKDWLGFSNAEKDPAGVTMDQQPVCPIARAPYKLNISQQRALVAIQCALTATPLPTSSWAVAAGTSLASRGQRFCCFNRHW